MDEAHLKRGITEFNRGYFFEAHDILEDLWMDTSGKDKLFLQGLIQVSVGFYHYFNSNYKGAVSQFSKGLAKLEAYLPAHCNVELEEFTEKVSVWRDAARAGLIGESVFVDESKVPRMILAEGGGAKEF
jgi:predicted metal-dependent hydrolase